MKQPNRSTIGTTGRTSRALGASDPRAHRNPQAMQTTELLFEHPLVVKDKRLRLVKSARVEPASGDSVEDLRETLNTLIRALQSAGLME